MKDISGESSQHVLDKAGELRSSLTKQSGVGSKILVPADRVQEIEDRIANLEAVIGGIIDIIN